MSLTRKHSLVIVLFVLLPPLATVRPTLADEGNQTRAFSLLLDAPIATWDEAIPLGNGMLGGLLWGTDNTINLSLDRADLWDETTPPEIREGNWNYANMRRLAKEDFGEMMRRYDGSYNHPAPTKLPGGRLVLTLSPMNTARSFELDMKRAIGTVALADEGSLQCFFSAQERVALIRVDDAHVKTRFIRPEGLDRLNYGPARFGENHDSRWMVQEASDGLVYATLTTSRQVGDQTLIAVAITTNREDANQPDPLLLARSRTTRAMKLGFDSLFQSHTQWWARFWEQSELTIPDDRLLRHYNLVKYFYGAASRPDVPSMPLQAVWTQDSGGLPPWKGDFHHDLNTQMTYLAYHKAGLIDSGMSFINHMWQLVPEYRRFSRDFFGQDGLAVPTVMTLHGKPLGGWPQYSLSPTYAIWIGHSFYLHWKHTMDHDFLRQRAYPWMNGILRTIVAILEEQDGKLYLPLSSSAEIFDATPRAFLKPNSNQDLALLQWAFEAMAEMADALGNEDDVAKWRALRGKLDPLHVDDREILMFGSEEPFRQSHRHHAQTMAIHPFATLNIDGSEQDRQVIDASLAEMVRLGTQAWTGYSFSWFACLLARANQPELAFEYLTYYERAFVLRNGFHANGDQLGAGLSSFRYRPFTLEGNFLAMEALHDMVLQTWPVDLTEDPTPVIRIFPAMPWRWHTASFRHLRAEGGFVVSATRTNNATIHFEIEATVDGRLRLRNNFGSIPLDFSREMTEDGQDLVLEMKAGETLVGTREAPDRIPPEPPESHAVRRRLAPIERRHTRSKTAVPSRRKNVETAP